MHVSGQYWPFAVISNIYNLEWATNGIPKDTVLEWEWSPSYRNVNDLTGVRRNRNDIHSKNSRLIGLVIVYIKLFLLYYKIGFLLAYL